MADTSNDLQKCRNRLVKREIKLLYFSFFHVEKKIPQVWAVFCLGCVEELPFAKFLNSTHVVSPPQAFVT